MLAATDWVKDEGAEELNANSKGKLFNWKKKTEKERENWKNMRGRLREREKRDQQAKGER